MLPSNIVVSNCEVWGACAPSCKVQSSTVQSVQYSTVQGFIRIGETTAGALMMPSNLWCPTAKYGVSTHPPVSVQCTVHCSTGVHPHRGDPPRGHSCCPPTLWCPTAKCGVSTAPSCKVQYSTVQYRYSTVQGFIRIGETTGGADDAVQHCGVQLRSMGCVHAPSCKVQYSTVQYSTLQYRVFIRHRGDHRALMLPSNIVVSNCEVWGEYAPSRKVQYSTVQYSTVQYRGSYASGRPPQGRSCCPPTLWCPTAKCGVSTHPPVKYSTVQYIHCSTVQY